MQARLADIQTFPMVYPTVGRFKFFEGPGGRPMGRQSVLVKITADTGPQFVRRSVLRQPLAVVSGELGVPAGPGLGGEVDEARILQHRAPDT